MKHNAFRLASEWARTCLVLMLLSAGSGYAQNQCASGASLENPAATQSGLGGWFRSLLDRIDPPRYEDMTTARPGIGGTGIDNGGMGGTGIVGVVTGFASVCVNGVEVHFDRHTEVVADGQRVSTRELAIGQLVAVRAQGDGDEVAAQRIAVMHAAIGPVSRVDAQNGTLETLGQSVRAAYPDDLASLKSGDWVQISGLRSATGEILATRIAPVPPRSQAQLSGLVENADSGGFRIQGARVDVRNLSAPLRSAEGNEVSVRGQWDGGVLRAESLDVEPTRAQLGRVDRVVIEGLVHGVRGQEYSVGGRSLTLGTKVQVSGNQDRAFAVNQRVRVTGVVGTDQRVTVSRIEVRSETDRRAPGRSGKEDGRRSRSGGTDDSGSDDSKSGSSGSGSDDSGKSGSGKSSSDSGSSGSSGSSGGSGSGKGK